MSRPFPGTVFIWFLAVSIASLLLITGSTPAPAPLAKKTPSINNYQLQQPIVPVKKVEKAKKAPTYQPPLETWQGPIQPLPAEPAPGLPPVIIKVPTDEPVVFVGIDDGWVQTPEALAWLTQNRLPFSLFLTDDGIKNNYNYFLQLQAAGMTIEDHTLSHPDLTNMSLAHQEAEICGAADTYANVFGTRPTLFRPPYGRANLQTFQAAQACGMKEIVMWRAVVQNGVLQYQDDLTHLEPGDIVLMHFTPNFLADIQALINQAKADNLQISRLEDWLP